MLEAVDGFIIVLGKDGHILYTSESMASLLGYMPSSLHNTTLYEIVGDGDKIPLYNTLNMSSTAENMKQQQVGWVKGVQKTQSFYFVPSAYCLRPHFFSIFERLFFLEHRSRITTTDCGKYAERLVFYEQPLNLV